MATETAQDPTRHAQPVDSGDVEHAWIPQGQSTAAYLEDLTLQLIRETATLGYQSALLRKHAHQDFLMADTAHYNCLVTKTQGVETILENLEELMQSDVSFGVEVLNVTASVQRGTRFAEVYMTTLETSTPHEQAMKREACSVLYWERRLQDGVWIVYRHASMRGSGGGVW